MIPFFLALAVFFSPKGGTEAAIVAKLRAAQKSIYVQAYGFTSAPIAAELIAARNLRHLDVRVILDSAWPVESPKVGPLLASNSVQVLVDGKHAIAHNKVIIIDDRMVLTGSYNFTWQSEHANAENLIIISSSKTAATYKWNWLQHASHSSPFLLPVPPSPSP